AQAHGAAHKPPFGRRCHHVLRGPAANWFFVELSGSTKTMLHVIDRSHSGTLMVIVLNICVAMPEQGCHFRFWNGRLVGPHFGSIQK
ncbi:MAG: hypothetical protein ACO3RW_06280, partial [Burkholderiaceae bacterium]